MQIIRCCRCGLDKPRAEFSDGMIAARNYRCRPCRAEYARSRYHSNVEKSRAYQRSVSQKHRLKYRYGLTVAAWNALVEKQDSRCAICGAHSENPSTLHVDHDHNSGAVRQLLCNNCNMGIGYFAEDPDRLLQAALYIQRHRAEASGPLSMESSNA